MISESDKSAFIGKALEAFSELQREAPSLRSLFSSLSTMGELAIFGGAIRDLVIFSDMRLSRDIDIVVSVMSDDELVPIFRKLPMRRTRFGGFHCILDGISLDVWALGTTWAFKAGLLETHVKNLPRSVFLSIDAIVLTLTARQLYEYRFFESIAKKTIDIVLEENPFPALCVLRSLVLRKKYDFFFSDSLRTYIREYWSKHDDPLTAIDETQISHYGEQVISKRQVMDEIEKNVL